MAFNCLPHERTHIILHMRKRRVKTDFCNRCFSLCIATIFIYIILNVEKCPIRLALNFPTTNKKQNVFNLQIMY